MRLLKYFCCAVLLFFPMVKGSGAVAEETTGLDTYFRLAMLFERSQNATFSDQACQPAGGNVPYFGCGSVNDGRMIGAYGDFGSGLGGELALGIRLNRFWRSELVAGKQNGFTFKGNANFSAAGSNQPVQGSVRQTRIGIKSYLDILPLLGKEAGMFQPFLGAGVGVSRNEIKTMQYDFPHLNQPRYTTVPGGSKDQFMWTILAGTALKLNSRNFIDVSAHYADYGSVQTSAGDIAIVRPTSTLHIPVHPTSAKLKSYGFSIGLRSHF